MTEAKGFMKLFKFYVPAYGLEIEIKSYTCVIPEYQITKGNQIFWQNHKIYEAECKNYSFFYSRNHTGNSQDILFCLN